MGSHITTDTKSITTYQFNLKSKVIAATLNCNMKTFSMASLVFLIVAIAFIANATGGMSLYACPEKSDQIIKCWEGLESGSGSAEVVACCKEQGASEECIKYCEKDCEEIATALKKPRLRIFL